jgi:hypothetical protein
MDVRKWAVVGLKFIPYVGAFVNAAEKIKVAKGSEKKQRVLDAVALGIEATEFAADRDILNDPKVVEATAKYIDAVVALQNAIALSKQAREGVK